MLYSQCLISLASSAFLCSATKVLPPAQRAVAESEAFAEIHNVMLRARGNPGARNAPIDRRWNDSGRPAGDTSSESPFAAIKRTLLGKRQLTCDAGYGLCTVSLRCCPDTGDNGGCCDDGQCVTKGQTCCSNGGACDTGLKCCGPFTCAPQGAECCSDGNYCDPGLHCVILRGVRGCCKDLRCSGFDSGADVSSPSSFTVTPIPIPTRSITRLSFTPRSITPIHSPSTTIPSINPLSFPSITLPTPIVPPATAARYTYRYYTYTWTWYYYTYFITTIPPTIRQPTSTEVTTTTTVSVYATNSAEARGQFDSITLAAAVPTAVTAPGYADVATSEDAESTVTGFRAGGSSTRTSTAFSGDSGAAVSGAVRRFGGFAALLLSSCLGLGIGVLAVWL